MIQFDLDEVGDRFRQLTETELMEFAQRYDELVEPVQTLLRAEFDRRSLLPPLLEDQTSDVLEGQTLVTIRRFRDLPEAFVARTVLESAGIPCYLQDENTVRMDWLWSNMIGGARLQVAEADVDEAMKLLDQPMPATFAIEGDISFDQPKCPACGSINIGANDTDRKVKLASTLVYGLPLVVGLPVLAGMQTGVWKCSVCGCRWTDDEESPDDPKASAP